MDAGHYATATGVQERSSVRCGRLFPVLSDRVRRSTWGLKVVVVLLHAVSVGVLFLFDAGLVRKTREEPWYTAIYLGFLVAALVQYFITSSSSPGYVIDVMRAESGTHTTFTNTRADLEQSISRNGSSISSMSRNQLGRLDSRIHSSSWLKLVMDLYPPGSAIRNWTCQYCSIIQPPRSKHCPDCDRCVLQFDHHCVWLGTCIGQGNHCRFWWYIFEETVVCFWTVVLYVSFLHSEASKDWWKDFIVAVILAALILCLIFLLLLLFFHSYLILTNQTTYELVRRRRILYLRGIPQSVHPFSKGICRNLYTFCCSRSGNYPLEAVPTMEELEARARPYTCRDIICCRCC